MASKHQQLAEVEAEFGEALRWPALDVDIYLPGLLLEVLQMQRVAARARGQVKSAAKAAAAS